MPAGVPPKNASFQDKSDVKTNNPDPSSDLGGETKATATDQTVEDVQPVSQPDPLAELTEEDVAEYSAGNKIPYSRFKEVNEAKKTAEVRLKELETQYQSSLQKAIDDAELRTSAKIEREARERVAAETTYSEEDPWDSHARKTTGELSKLEAKIASLESQASQTRMTSELSRLKEVYPDADEMAVLGWATRSNDSVESLMKKSHERNSAFVQDRINKILSHKKQRARSAVPTREGGIRLKPSDRPKTFADAKKMASDYFRSINQR